jgi:hypothetical protein
MDPKIVTGGRFSLVIYVIKVYNKTLHKVFAIIDQWWLFRGNCWLRFEWTHKAEILQKKKTLKHFLIDFMYLTFLFLSLLLILSLSLFLSLSLSISQRHTNKHRERERDRDKYTYMLPLKNNQSKKELTKFLKIQLMLRMLGFASNKEHMVSDC